MHLVEKNIDLEEVGFSRICETLVRLLNLFMLRCE